ncbi:MAG: TetR/AcrR family transcriptional regulator [Gammaproteobacteria bacterium]|nr:TetR/AcrR family transcriptional regulator [Gammaproteobacteria bacterium]MBL6998537.1 TetR/AcrR family transcriptional regulator [Gammaproteobacteria bacterium]
MTNSNLTTRDKVLAAALRLFTAKGYFSTSMRDITHESAVSTGSVYHYFKDKEGVASALYQTTVARMCSEFEAIINRHESAHDRCRAVIALLLQLAEQEPDSMSFMLYTKHREFLPLERPVCSSEPFNMMRSMVETGIQRGEIVEQDVVVASSCLFGPAIRLITSHLDGILQHPPGHYLDQLWRCSWKAVS